MWTVRKTTVGHFTSISLLNSLKWKGRKLEYNFQMKKLDLIEGLDGYGMTDLRTIDIIPLVFFSKS